MPAFFLPGADAVAAEAMLARLATHHGVPLPWIHDRIYAIRYRVAGQHHVAAVGNPITSYTYPYSPVFDANGRLASTAPAGGGPVVTAILSGDDAFLICVAHPGAFPGEVVKLEGKVEKVDWFS